MDVVMDFMNPPMEDNVKEKETVDSAKNAARDLLMKRAELAATRWLKNPRDSVYEARVLLSSIGLMLASTLTKDQWDKYIGRPNEICTDSMLVVYIANGYTLDIFDDSDYSDSDIYRALYAMVYGDSAEDGDACHGKVTADQVKAFESNFLVNGYSSIIGEPIVLTQIACLSGISGMANEAYKVLGIERTFYSEDEDEDEHVEDDQCDDNDFNDDLDDD